MKFVKCDKVEDRAELIEYIFISYYDLFYMLILVVITFCARVTFGYYDG